MASNNRTGHKPQQAGVAASFPYDRRTVERFIEVFPRARWNHEQKAWFVPGKTAARRIERWLAQEGPFVVSHAVTGARRYGAVVSVAIACGLLGSAKPRQPSASTARSS